MAKEKRSAADLDAELAALEAELAALEGKPKKKVEKPAKKKETPLPGATAPTSAPSAAPEPRAEAAPAPAPAKEEKKGRFSMPKVPKLGRRKADEGVAASSEAAPTAAALAPGQGPAPAPAPAPARGASPVPREAPADDTSVADLVAAPAKAFEHGRSYDLSLWRQEGDAWIRVVPETPLPVVRRVLDENGNVVREERAQDRDVESVGSVRAERGLGRLLRRKG
jgi:hypothetical protein